MNPTMMGIENSLARYKSINPHLQKAIESHPLVSQHGMPPNMALDLLNWSRKGNEGIGDVAARYLTPHSRTPTIPRARPAAAESMVTAVGGKKMPSMATKAEPKGRVEVA